IGQIEPAIALETNHDWDELAFSREVTEWDFVRRDVRAVPSDVESRRFATAVVEDIKRNGQSAAVAIFAERRIRQIVGPIEAESIRRRRGAVADVSREGRGKGAHGVAAIEVIDNERSLLAVDRVGQMQHAAVADAAAGSHEGIAENGRVGG